MRASLDENKQSQNETFLYNYFILIEEIPVQSKCYLKDPDYTRFIKDNFKKKKIKFHKR